MKISYHTLHWDNVDKRILDSHKKVFNHFGIDIQYTNMNVNQGVWMTSVCRNTISDVYVFFEVDCVPLNKQVIDDCIKYAVDNNSMVILRYKVKSSAGEEIKTTKLKKTDFGKIVELVKSGSKLNAVSTLKEKTGLSLKSSKDIIDSIKIN